MMKNRGLTLLELIISSAIFVVIMTVIYTSFSSGIFGTKMIDESMRLTSAARIIFGRINSDLLNSFSFSKEETRFSGKEEELTFMTITDSFIEESLFPEYSLVSYTQDQGRLLRLCRKNKDALNQDSKISPQELFPNAKIKFEYGYYSIPDDQIIFKDSWATDESDPLLEENKNPPLVVKVNLNLKNRGEENFSRTIYIPYTQLVR